MPDASRLLQSLVRNLYASLLLDKFEAVIDATLDSGDLAPMETSPSVTSEAVLADIRQILTDDCVQLQ